MERREELLEPTPDQELTPEELTAAVKQHAPGQAPGVDGLSAGGFKCFWKARLRWNTPIMG